jgi:putative endonuclease
MSDASHISLGKQGEAVARNYLIKRGYTILDTNWRYLKGEIDIIATIDDIIAMVEVKTRSTYGFGDPEESIGTKKLRLLYDTADRYMTVKEIELEVRYDVISVVFHGDTWTIEHIPDAYYPFMNT